MFIYIYQVYMLQTLNLLKQNIIYYYYQIFIKKYVFNKKKYAKTVMLMYMYMFNLRYTLK